ncbi:hypothetical protein ACRRTK_022606 [Alexandromys fortis]
MKSLLEIPRFVLTVAEEGLQHLVCILRVFLGSERAEKNKGNIACFLRSLASPLSSLYSVFFDPDLLPIALSLPQTSCFPGECWR